MLKIRLIRTGKKNAPSYRIVLIEKNASPKSGKFLEILGNYNPRLKEINLKKDRIVYWLGQGAQASDTVHNLLISQGTIKGDKIKKKFKIKKKEEKLAPPGGEEKPIEEKKDEVEDEVRPSVKV
ncbi:30S ribosomal protein S16 [Patescibacteria group bacterium]|nr:30S ribosomal protein S16 [Patescibacteria group bacterium]MBU1563540.1 30S ribosomal protein S16 [Patescibacteria group bacterium]